MKLHSFVGLSAAAVGAESTTLTFERLPGKPNQDDFEPLLPRKWVQAQEAQQERAA